MATGPTGASVEEFVAAVPNARRRRDALTMIDLLRRISGQEPSMWGPTIIGFGEYHYRYASGRTGSAGAAGFSPRSTSTTVYFPDGVDAYADQLATLGPHTLGKSCLYLTDLEAVDLTVLEDMLRRSWETVSAPGFGQVD